jgi:hypothetical protein
LPGRLEAFAGEQVAGALIGDGEGIAVLAVAEQELALVVGAPELVGRQGGGEGRAAGLVPLKDLVAGDPGDAELPAQRRHLLAFVQAGDESKAFIHRFTLKCTFPCGSLARPHLSSR